MFDFLFPDDPRAPRAPSSPSDARMAAEQAVVHVEQRLKALELACAGLWELLKTKHGYSDDELAAAVYRVDARDGQVDGQMTRMNDTCPHCHKKLLTRSPIKCAWCGGLLAAKPFG